jgi:hypothetical protein
MAYQFCSFRLCTLVFAILSLTACSQEISNLASGGSVDAPDRLQSQLAELNQRLESVNRQFPEYWPPENVWKSRILAVSDTGEFSLADGSTFRFDGIVCNEDFFDHLRQEAAKPDVWLGIEQTAAPEGQTALAQLWLLYALEGTPESFAVVPAFENGILLQQCRAIESGTNPQNRRHLALTLEFNASSN